MMWETVYPFQRKKENIMEAIEKIENSRLKLKMEEIVDGFLVSWY